MPAVLTATADPGRASADTGAADYVTPVVRVVVTGAASSGYQTVTRINADGSTAAVRSRVFLSTGAGQVNDWEAPYSQPVAYVLSAEEDSGTSDPVILDPPVAWLINVFRPGSAVPLLGASMVAPALAEGTLATRTRATSTRLVQPMGPRLPIAVTSGGRRGRTSELLVRTRTDAQAAALDQLIADDATLLLNVPASLPWGVGTRYISVGDDEENRRPGLVDALRLWRLPFTEVSAPVGTLRAVWAYADLPDTYASYGDMQRAYATYADLERDRRRVTVT